MKTFDWIDFDYSWKQSWDKKIVLKEFHSSTTSLLSKYLRRRSFEFRKIFLWMRTRPGFDVSSNGSVFYIESGFNFDRYDGGLANERLSMFSRWVLQTIASSAPELVKTSEVEALLDRLTAEDYTCVREDAIQMIPGNRGSKCKVFR